MPSPDERRNHFYDDKAKTAGDSGLFICGGLFIYKRQSIVFHFGTRSEMGRDTIESNTERIIKLCTIETPPLI